MLKRKTTIESYLSKSSTYETDVEAEPLKAKLARHIGKVAAVSAIAVSMLGVANADSGPRDAYGPEQETTRTVVDTHTVPIEGEERVALLMNQGPSLMVSQEFAPGFAATMLGDGQRSGINESVQNAADYLRQNPSATMTLRIDGDASDESGSEAGANLGVASEQNRRLAEQRRDLAYEQAVSYMHGFEDRLTIEKGTAQETLLPLQDQAWVAQSAENRGMTTASFMKQYNNNRASLNLSDDEKMTMVGLFDAHRGAKIASFVNETGIDPTASSVLLQREVRTERQEAIDMAEHYEGRHGVKLLPFFAATVGAAGLAGFLRRRKDATEDGGERQTWWQKPRPEMTPHVENGTFEDAVGTTMARGHEIPRIKRWDQLHADGTMIGYMKRRGAELYEEIMTGHDYKGNQSKLGRKSLAAAALIGGIASLIPVPVTTPDTEYVQPVVTETDQAFVETTPAHRQYSRLKFVAEVVVGKIRRPVISTQTIPETVKVIPKPHVRTVYTFDTAGNLISSNHAV